MPGEEILDREFKIVEAIRLNIRPGDALILKVPHTCPEVDAHRVIQILESKLGIKVIVLSEAVTVVGTFPTGAEEEMPKCQN